jgi:hypothetical protein
MGPKFAALKSYLVVEIATTIGYLFAKFKEILPLIGMGYYD